MDNVQQKTPPYTKNKNTTNDSTLIESQREFKVPVDRLFKAFTHSEAIKAWWWPNGLRAGRADIDFKIGGHYFINMEGSGPSKGGMTGQFEEIVENKLIVMTDQFADKEGRAISAVDAKMPGQWPEKVYITFEFASINNTASRLNFTQQGIPKEMYDDCMKGWTEMFDKLERYLTSSQQ